ncbi:MAG: hypothetical protein ACYCT2_04795 [Thermoplasmataceae archaeon]
MKTLVYGPMKISLDLTPDEEKVFLEAIESDIAAARKFHAWRFLRTGLENGIPELSGLSFIRDKAQKTEGEVL